MTAPKKDETDPATTDKAQDEQAAETAAPAPAAPTTSCPVCGHNFNPADPQASVQQPIG